MFNKNIMYLTTSTVYGVERGDAGRRHTGLGVDLLKYPKTIVNLEFSYHGSADAGNITCRTAEGLPVNVGVAMQYTLETANLANFYLRYGDIPTQKKFLARYARSAILDVCVMRPIAEWFPNRTALGTDFFNHVAKVFTPEGAKMRSLQLLYIGIPSDVQKQIEDTAVAYQGIQQAQYNVSAEQVRADTRLLKVQQSNLIVGIQAEAFANKSFLAANAAARALNLSVSSEIDVYKNATSTLNMTKDELLAYMWLHTVRGNMDSNQIIEVGLPSTVGTQ